MERHDRTLQPREQARHETRADHDIETIVALTGLLTRAVWVLPRRDVRCRSNALARNPTL